MIVKWNIRLYRKVLDHMFYTKCSRVNNIQNMNLKPYDRVYAYVKTNVVPRALAEHQ